jgi:multidrug resistance efflux pump
VKAAAIGVRSSEVDLNRLSKLFANKVVGKEEVEKAQLEVEMSKAQLDIRVAEVKEVDVKIKHAKKRLDEAKRNGARPAPPEPTVPVELPGSK